MHQSVKSGRGPRNPFFKPPGEDAEEKGGPGRVYGAIEVAQRLESNATDVLDEAEPVFFECIDTAWFHNNYSRGAEWVGAVLYAPLLVLALEGYPMPPLPDNAAPGDIVWFEFGFEPARGVEADGRVYRNILSEGESVKITFYEPRPLDFAANSPWGGDMALISEMHAETKGSVYGPGPKLRKLLAESHSTAGVAIYDVGQGSCQAVVDTAHYVPLLYVDIGGGVIANEKTFPDRLHGLCFSCDPPIVLSHWDFDHWSSALRFLEALDAEWFAPSVPTKPIQQAMAAELFSRGLLHIWPVGGPAEYVGKNVSLERCTGKTYNDSGIAVTFHRSKPSGNNCLLPGDADFQFIPSVVAKRKFSAICMTHHGGRLHSATYPIAKRGAVAANSSGPRNSYKHPLFDTIGAHLEAGWPLPVQTGLSGQRPCHVLLPWGQKPHYFQGGCHGPGSCNIAPAKAAPGTLKLANWATLSASVAKSKAKVKSLAKV
ncbi:hypothetical protein [Janthinobacterium sp. 64]|uniref:hypothetical protein n=1 Tax=Janthinobacterium sp. 64 TaxID=2035208 RepID=UPI000C2BCF82|nr:hypothetical protein [Janthinobacterium sp. 64]PKB13815.1 hypothetical protein CLU91_5434 [Janthinobacterium sp. 64]